MSDTDEKWFNRFMGGIGLLILLAGAIGVIALARCLYVNWNNI
jgi:hypothetical protein